MFKGDMKYRRENAIKKVWDAIEEHNGQNLLSTGITGDDARVAKAVVDGGIKLLEPNHPAVDIAKGHKGITTIEEAEKIRQENKVEEMSDIIVGVRIVVVT